MRTISINKKALFLLILPLWLGSLQCVAQDSSRKKANYSLDLYLGAGASRYVASLALAAPGVENKQYTHPAGTFRVMWQTDHRLALGLESGFISWYSYDVKHDTVSANVKLTSIPLLITWSMPVIEHVKIFAGFGTYITTTHLQTKTEVSSKTNSLGWLLELPTFNRLKKIFPSLMKSSGAMRMKQTMK